MRILLYCCVATVYFIVLNIGFISGEEIERFSVNASTTFGNIFKESLNRVKRNNRNIKRTFAFNRSQRRTSVNAHNKARRNVRPRAADMREMSWDNKLGALALSYSRRCVFRHNPSRRHSCFNSVGENIYISTGIQFNNSYINEAIASFVDEKVDYNFQSNTCTPGRVCGHYTQVVWADSFKVGCGATLCNSVIVNGRRWRDATILVCNYGPAGNFVGSKPYIPGRPCSRCSNRRDSCKRRLCFNRQRTSPNRCSY